MQFKKDKKIKNKLNQNFGVDIYEKFVADSIIEEQKRVHSKLKLSPVEGYIVLKNIVTKKKTIFTKTVTKWFIIKLRI